jgi:myosin-1
LLVPRPLRSSKPSPRILILTNTWLYLVVAAVEKKLVTLKVERKVSLTSIKAVSASTLQDDWIVVHVNDPQNVDLVLITSFKTELCAHMVQQTGGSFNVQVASEFDYIKKPGKTATLKFVKDEKATGDGEYKSHTISICTGAPATSVSDPPCAKKHVPVRPVAAGKLLKKGGPSKTPMKRPVARPFPTATHVPMNAPAARKVETVSSSVSVATKMATPPSLTKKPPTATKPTPTPVSVQPVVAPVPVKIPSPVQPVVVKKAEVVKPVEVEKKATAPRPPPARQPPPPVQRPASPRYETLYDFEPEDDGEIAFSTGDVLKILEKDDNGWWLARKVNGDEGWVPANYVREIKVAVKSPPPLPNKKPSRKVPTPSASVEVERQPESLHVKPLAHERSASPAVEEPEEEEVPKKKPSLLTKPTTYTYQEPADDAPRPMFPTQSSDASIPLWKQELMARKKAKEGPAGASTVSYKTTVAQEEEEGAATMGAGGVARLAAAFSQNPGGMGFGKWQKPKRDPSPPPEADDDWDD